MSMSKKDFIALADSIKLHNSLETVSSVRGAASEKFTNLQVLTLANFCARSNPHFDRAKWLGYLNGENGPSGGAVKGKK